MYETVRPVHPLPAELSFYAGTPTESLNNLNVKMGYDPNKQALVNANNTQGWNWAYNRR